MMWLNIFKSWPPEGPFKLGFSALYDKTTNFPVLTVNSELKPELLH